MAEKGNIFNVDVFFEQNNALEKIRPRIGLTFAHKLATKKIKKV